MINGKYCKKWSWLYILHTSRTINYMHLHLENSSSIFFFTWHCMWCIQEIRFWHFDSRKNCFLMFKSCSFINFLIITDGFFFVSLNIFNSKIYKRKVITYKMSDFTSYVLWIYLVHQNCTITLLFITFEKLCVYCISSISPVRLFFLLWNIFGYFTMKKN